MINFTDWLEQVRKLYSEFWSIPYSDFQLEQPYWHRRYEDGETPKEAFNKTLTDWR